MAQQASDGVPPGWIGGFDKTNPKFPYPTADLSSLPLTGNLVNIDKLQRQQKVLWPEFSWQTAPGLPPPFGGEASRCFQMFAPDISRLGYDDTGRSWSIICPQQGACSAVFGCLNIEVTVTGQRGWVDETIQTAYQKKSQSEKEKDCGRDYGVAADLTAEAKIWFSPSGLANPMIKALWKAFVRYGLPFPDDKAHALILNLHSSEDKNVAFLKGRTGETTRFKSPDFAKHWDKAWAVANLEVQIGEIRKTNPPIEIVDDFNELVMFAFNVASGNLLALGNILTWNVWFEEPTLVDQQEWADHAAKWRDSIDADHGSPCGQGTPVKYFDGRLFDPTALAILELIAKIWEFYNKHLRGEKLKGVPDKVVIEAIDTIVAWLEKHEAMARKAL
jgi:hypothetical protein